MPYRQGGYWYDDEGRMLVAALAGGAPLPAGSYEQGGSNFTSDGKLIVYDEALDLARSSAVQASGSVIPRVSRDAVISTFQSGHGWTKTGGNGTVSDDTTVCLSPQTQSLKLAFAGDQVALTADKTFTAIDLSAKVLKVAVRMDDRAHIKELSLQVTADNFVNFSKCTVVPQTPYVAGDNHAWVQEGDFWVCTLSRGDFGSGAGTTNWAAINKIRLRGNDNGIACNAWVQVLGFQPDPPSGIVVLQTDDGDASVLTFLKTLSEYGFPSVINIIAERIGQAGSLTLAQLQAARDQGHQIAPHPFYDTGTHTPGYDGISAAAAETDMQLLKRYLIDTVGVSPDDAQDLALPHGTWTVAQRALFRKYTRSVRSVYGGVGTARATVDTLPPGDPYRLRCWQVQSTDTPATLLAAVDKAMANKELLVLLFHQFVSSVTTPSIQYLTTDMTTFVDGLAGVGSSRAITPVVRTMASALRQPVG
jgi:peptidoglycan/xylan/chitin deacetylase (PgdA/CDA1 family)